jgi:hypothetical protein
MEIRLYDVQNQTTSYLQNEEESEQMKDHTQAEGHAQRVPLQTGTETFMSKSG